VSPLPLLTRVAEDGVTFVMTPRVGRRPAGSRPGWPGSSNAAGGALALDGRMPSRAPVEDGIVWLGLPLTLVDAPKTEGRAR